MALKDLSLDELEAYDLALAAEKEAAYAGVYAVREKQKAVRAEYSRRAVLARFGEMNEAEQAALLEAMGAAAPAAVAEPDVVEED